MTDLYIDWDNVEFDTFPRARELAAWCFASDRWLVATMEKWAGKRQMFQFRYRRSSRRHLHVWVHAHRLSEVEQFALRALLRDDRTRLVIDLARLATGQSINRLWDTKWVEGRTYTAGPWTYWRSFIAGLEPKP